jgi:Spy/CpxP family protein refolding chaperone
MKPTVTHLLPLALLLALGMPAPASAQQSTPTPPPKAATPSKDAPPAKHYGNADEPENDATLYLTDDQKARIKAIRADADQQIQAADKDPALTPEQKERRVKQIRKATRAQVFAVLTPDQQKTWSAEQREKREAKSSAAPKAQ